METDGRLTRGMLFGHFANKGDGFPPHIPSDRLLIVYMWFSYLFLYFFCSRIDPACLFCFCCLLLQAFWSPFAVWILCLDFIFIIKVHLFFFYLPAWLLVSCVCVPFCLKVTGVSLIILSPLCFPDVSVLGTPSQVGKHFFYTEINCLFGTAQQ